VLLDVVRLVGGGLVLYLGAEYLVKGAAGLAASLGIPPLIIGLTVVGYGTSAPEIAVSVAAALRGSPAIAVGNALGSNIANLGLILGMTALVSPPRTDGALVRREVPLLLLTTAALPLIFLDGRAARLEGFALVAVAIGITAWMIVAGLRAGLVRQSEDELKLVSEVTEEAGGPAHGGRLRLAIYSVVGLAGLVLGGEFFVKGATGIARAFGVEERIVGLTIVAIGTSLPELATSLIAARRGHGELAVGNVVGSNLFNVLLVLGIAASIRPIEMPLPTIAGDLVVLGSMTVFAAFMLRTERRLTRTEGTILLLGYVAFLVRLILVR
jgi:cation:H+ antiporter